MAGERAHGRRRWRVVALAAVAVVVVGVVIAVVVTRSAGQSWGTPTDRVASPSGEYEVVTYEWSAMIDPGWTLAIQRVGGDQREWFWRNTEDPGPKAIRFTGPTSIEVTDSWDQVYRVNFEPNSLEPSDRFCLRTGYCSDAPWNSYTRESP
jgi:hypothetical protein